jgi:hypothetical protein
VANVALGQIDLVASQNVVSFMELFVAFALQRPGREPWHLITVGQDASDYLQL